MPDDTTAPAESAPAPVKDYENLVNLWFNENIAGSVAAHFTPAVNHLMSVLPALVEILRKG